LELVEAARWAMWLACRSIAIEFADREVVVNPGQSVTVPAGTLHRTRPAGERSVNLTFERAGTITVFEE